MLDDNSMMESFITITGIKKNNRDNKNNINTNFINTIVFAIINNNIIIIIVEIYHYYS